MQELKLKWHFPPMFVVAAALSGCGSGASVMTQATPSSVPGEASPTVALSPSPTAVAQGQSAILSWSSTNATACTASGAWSGSVATSGSQSTGPLDTTANYVLTCSGTGGSASQSATVTVTGSATQPTVSISASPTNVASGAGATLTWSSISATACTASGAWSGSEPVSGTHSTGALSSNATYTLTCTGPGGEASQSATVTVSTGTPPPPPGLSCTGSSGALNLKVNAVRDTGISPFLVFFDATGTTDSSFKGNTTTFQDVTYTWDFGDSGASGTETWAYGAHPGHNNRNTATGGVAAHLYVTPGVDTAYTMTVTAHDGLNTATCQISVTAYDPAGAHGFGGSKTTCVSASGTPTAGAGGCPAGATTLKSSRFNAALGSTYLGSGKRVLFKCGDTFTGDNATLGGTKWSVGAYGGCEGTRTNRPILRDSGTSGELLVATTAGDGRIADLDLEGNGTAAYAVGTLGSSTRIPYQITLSNLYSNGNNSSYSWSQGAQWAVVDSVMTGMRTSIGTFVNFNENNPATWSGNLYNNVDYQALLGSGFDGAGGTNDGSGQETVRISACRMCVIENNTFENANNIGAVLKLHNGNTNNSIATWTGVYTELIEISDNWFGGTSGAQYMENAPQNGGLDERLRNIVVERNLFSGSTGAQGGRQLLVSAVNETVRDNVFYMTGNPSKYPAYGVQVAQRGVEPIPSGVEIYNNTCYAPSASNGEACVGFDGLSFRGPPTGSFAENNLFYVPAGGHSTVINKGTGNTLAGNTASPTGNPAFTNGSGQFNIISDFKPTANYSGGVAVPVWADALGVVWSPTWDLGAVHH